MYVMRRYLKASHNSAIAHCHEASLRTCAHATAQLLRASLCAREKITGSKFDRLFEVIFKDLAVPAVSVKLTLGSWFVLAVTMFY